MYESGEMSDEERQRFDYTNRAWDRKLEDIEAGRYEPTNEAFREAVLTERIRDKLQGMYRAQGKSSEDGRGEYQRPDDQQEYKAA